nr:hypothetical protein [Tanacetum cinerariifolium]
MDYMDTKELVNEGRLSEETEELKLTTDTEETAQDKGSGEKGESTKELVSTAWPEDSTVRPDVEGEGSGAPTEPQPTPSLTHPSTGHQLTVTESPSSRDTTQDSRDSLEGTNRSKGDQVQSPHDSPLLGGYTSDRAE